MNDNIVLTIGRQNGSGGRQIGEALAIKLGFSFYDKELIHEASKQSGLNKEFFEHIDEKASYSLFGGIFGTHSPMMEDVYSGYYLSNESLFTIQSNAIRNLAEQKSCVFVGRCADYVLKDYPKCLNVFISGDIEDRIKRISDHYQIPLQKAKETIEKMDKKR
ncbi:MAG: cytidylate kinase-like family protein, partial [Bacteroidales bacterium]|nr:cytidylate kinase-like family protein [Bacteroidales bacterium]